MAVMQAERSRDKAKTGKTKPGKAKTTGAKKVQDKQPIPQGWNSTDAEELERRQWRGQTDIAGVVALEPDQPTFGAFAIRSTSGSTYDVEIRSLVARENSCACPDWRVNGLGTCKHVEGALAALGRKGKRALAVAARAGSPRVEVFPAGDGSGAILVRWPADATAVAAILADHVTAEGVLAGDPLTSLPALRDALADAPSGSVRFSRHLDFILEEASRRRRRSDDRTAFLAEVAAGTATTDIVRHPLLPYQVEGMLHLAFAERALLADEMGLGKTVQAIAACELLRRRRDIRRVLVVVPASLKAEWEDQIDRFTDLTATIVSGPRAERLRHYASDSFFIIVNYEQVLIDWREINDIIGADVVVLDEAQRIKNWQTKTAQSVKRLRSPYAFVLTGTPLENRIDEVYSIVQYLNPALLGPLFRFNRDFYVLDDRGRPTNYKNLALLSARLAPVMLRRRKDEVEDQLPGRTVDTYYVAMSEEQRLRYSDYEAPVSRLAAIAKRRPLTKQEMDRLQQLLACMRMICDTPYILDQDCRISPKLDELENILIDLLAEPDRKIIIFSEWERMLQLVRERAGEMGVDHAWHTGSVPQDKRRVEIRRFKNDPACRLFLSTDSGSVGLNLQVASAVINMDLPWNPAKLEQRIARAWRKNQLKTVTVVNIVCEDSIEHRIQHLLTLKQDLADGVLDGRGNVGEIKMPSGRAAMLERLQGLLEPPAPEQAALPTPAPATRESVAASIVARLGEAVTSIARYARDGGGETLVVVMDGSAAALDEERERVAEQAQQAGFAEVQIVDRAAWDATRRLAAAGIIRLAEPDEVLHRSAAPEEAGEPADSAARIRNRKAALEWLDQADRKLRMAMLLADGGFAAEAMPALGDAATLAIRSLALTGDSALEPETVAATAGVELIELDAVRGQLPPGSVADFAALGGAEGDAAAFDVGRAAAQTLLDVARGAAG